MKGSPTPVSLQIATISPRLSPTLTERILFQASKNYSKDQAALSPAREQQINEMMNGYIKYLIEVKCVFGDKSEEYEEFLDTLKQYENRSISIQELFKTVSYLFRDHKDLFAQFLDYLPLSFLKEIPQDGPANSDTIAAVDASHIASDATGPSNTVQLGRQARMLSERTRLTEEHGMQNFKPSATFRDKEFQGKAIPVQITHSKQLNVVSNFPALRVEVKVDDHSNTRDSIEYETVVAKDNSLAADSDVAMCANNPRAPYSDVDANNNTINSCKEKSVVPVKHSNIHDDLYANNPCAAYREDQATLPAREPQNNERKIKIIKCFNKVKCVLGDKSEKHKEFLNNVGQYHSRSITTLELLRKVSYLFQDHEGLLIQFLDFLPPNILKAFKARNIQLFNGAQINADSRCPPLSQDKEVMQGPLDEQVHIKEAKRTAAAIHITEDTSGSSNSKQLNVVSSFPPLRVENKIKKKKWKNQRTCSKGGTAAFIADNVLIEPHRDLKKYGLTEENVSCFNEYLSKFSYSSDQTGRKIIMTQKIAEKDKQCQSSQAVAKNENSLLAESKIHVKQEVNIAGDFEAVVIDEKTNTRGVIENLQQMQRIDASKIHVDQEPHIADDFEVVVKYEETNTGEVAADLQQMQRIDDSYANCEFGDLDINKNCMLHSDVSSSDLSKASTSSRGSKKEQWKSNKKINTGVLKNNLNLASEEEIEDISSRNSDISRKIRKKTYTVQTEKFCARSPNA